MATLHLAQEIFKLIYPVGSVYISLNSTNPSNLFGGTWKSIEGRFLIGVGYSTDENGARWDFAARQAYGEYTHVLTLNEMPSHNHSCYDSGAHTHLEYLNLADKYDQGIHDYVNYGGWGQSSCYNPTSSAGTHSHSIGYAGASWQHNNMPPYFGVYMWERTT